MTTYIEHSARTRLPLAESTTNCSRPGSSDSLPPTYKQPQRPFLRRCSSLSELQGSDSELSIKDSIYLAGPCPSPPCPSPACPSPTLKDQLDALAPRGYKLRACNATFDILPPPKSSGSDSTSSLSERAVPLRQTSYGSSCGKFHWPTPLDPIIEKRSKSTLGHSLAASAPAAQQSQPRSLVSRLSRRSRAALQAVAKERRKASFSLSDMPCFKRSLARLVPTFRSPVVRCSPSEDEDYSIDGTARELDCSVFDPAAYPVRPVTAPPYRCSTPTGMPSFRSSQAATHIPRSHVGLKEVFNCAVLPSTPEWRFQTSNLPSGIMMRDRDGKLVCNKWDYPHDRHAGFADEPQKTSSNVTTPRMSLQLSRRGRGEQSDGAADQEGPESIALEQPKHNWVVRIMGFFCCMRVPDDDSNDESPPEVRQYLENAQSKACN